MYLYARLVLVLLVASFSGACRGKGPTESQVKDVMAKHWDSLDVGYGTVFQGDVIFASNANLSQGRVFAESLPFYKALANAGLISLDGLSELTGEFTGWDNYSAWQSGIRAIATVAPTTEGKQKGREATRFGRKVLQFKESTNDITEIVDNQAMKFGVDEYHVVVGTFTERWDPTFEPILTAAGITHQGGPDWKFKALLKYDQVMKTWSVLEEDLAERAKDFNTQAVDKRLAELGVRAQP